MGWDENTWTIRKNAGALGTGRTSKVVSGVVAVTKPILVQVTGAAMLAVYCTK